MAAVTEMVGVGKISRDLRVIRDRLASLEARLPLEFNVLEQMERDLFGRFMGKYQNTGALMASLTQGNAEGAIRRIHGAELEFGTSIWYARFQTRIGGPSGKPRGRLRPLPVRVLKLTPQARASASELVMRYVFEDLGL